MEEVKHTTIRNQSLFCLNCGGTFKLIYPIGINDMVNKTNAFNQLHKSCEKTWVEPNVDQTKTINEKAMWWLNNGHVGMSSKTMWNCLIGNKDFPINHPYDPDDFSRCYKLLEVVPEWRDKQYLNNIAKLSPAWFNLIQNWDKLTEMYEKNKKEDWINSKKIGMFDFMQKLIN